MRKECACCGMGIYSLPCGYCGYTGKAADYDYSTQRERLNKDAEHDHSTLYEVMNKEASDVKDLAIATRFANRIRLAMVIYIGGVGITADSAVAEFRSERPEKQRAILDLARFLEAKP